MMCMVRAYLGDAADHWAFFLSVIVFLYLNSREITQTFCISASSDCELLVFCFLISNNFLSSLPLSAAGMLEIHPNSYILVGTGQEHPLWCCHLPSWADSFSQCWNLNPCCCSLWNVVPSPFPIPWYLLITSSSPFSRAREQWCHCGGTCCIFQRTRRKGKFKQASKCLEIDSNHRATAGHLISQDGEEFTRSISAWNSLTCNGKPGKSLAAVHSCCWGIHSTCMVVCAGALQS